MQYSIAEAKIETKPLITGKIGIDEVPGAFNELRSPDTHAKIIVER